MADTDPPKAWIGDDIDSTSDLQFDPNCEQAITLDTKERNDLGRNFQLIPVYSESTLDRDNTIQLSMLNAVFARWTITHSECRYAPLEVRRIPSQTRSSFDV